MVIIFDGYVEGGLDIDNQDICMDGNYITIEGVMGGEKTWYVGDDIEFRQVGSSVEIIENVIGSDLVAAGLTARPYPIL